MWSTTDNLVCVLDLDRRRIHRLRQISFIERELQSHGNELFTFDYPIAQKLEIIRLVEQSHLSAKRTLDQLGIPRRTFYRWYHRYRDSGPEGLADRPSAPSRVWNGIPFGIQDQIIELALEQSELSPRDLAVWVTDERR